MNAHKSVLYTIIDFEENTRVTNNLIFNIYDYSKQEDCDKCLNDLIKGTTEITKRNRINLNIELC